MPPNGWPGGLLAPVARSERSRGIRLVEAPAGKHVARQDRCRVEGAEGVAAWREQEGGDHAPCSFVEATGGAPLLLYIHGTAVRWQDPWRIVDPRCLLAACRAGILADGSLRATVTMSSVCDDLVAVPRRTIGIVRSAGNQRLGKGGNCDG